MPTPSAVRRALLALALLVPLAVDPFGADTQGVKTALLTLAGGTLLALEGAAVLAGRPVPRTTGPEALLLLLCAWAAASLAWATNPALGSTRVLALVGVLGLARGVRAELAAGSSAWRWLAALMAAATLAVLVDFGLVLRAQPGLAEEAAKHASRLFVHNNMAAGWVACLVPLAIAGVLATAGWTRSLPWLAALALLVAGLQLYGSRASLLGAAIALPVTAGLVLAQPRLARARPPGRRLALLAGALVLAGALLPLSDTARGLAKDAYYAGVKLTGIEVEDGAFRQILWRKTLVMAAERPLSGVGAGNFPVVFPRFERFQAPKPHAHNDLLQVLSELGLPGALLFLALLAGTALLLLRGLLGRTDPARHALLAGLAGSLAVLFVGGLFEVPCALAATQALLAWMLGLGGALQPGGASSVPRASRLLGAVILAAGLLAAGLTAARLPASWLMARAEAAARAGELDAAEALYTRAAALGTGAYHPWRTLGLIARQRGRLPEALEHMRRARALAPHAAERMVDEGDVLGDMGRWDEAADAFAAAVALTPQADEPFFRLQLALGQSGQLARMVDACEQRVRQDTEVSLAVIVKLADAARRLADTVPEAEQERALVRARHWYAVLAQEDPARRPALDANFRDLTHRLQIRPGAPDTWFKGTYRRWLDQGGWGIPGPALSVSLVEEDPRLYPGWILPPEAFAPGSWRHPSLWKDG